METLLTDVYYFNERYVEKLLWNRHISVFICLTLVIVTNYVFISDTKTKYPRNVKKSDIYNFLESY